MSTRHGYLVLADISGYTSYVAGTELEHSQEILSELLELLVKRFESLLKIHKLEGDAVFAYVDETELKRGETLLEFLENVYVAFRDKLFSMRRATTCVCKACNSIPMLDLKFIAHHGDYVLQNVGSIREMIGSDVNLLHRLAKNHIAETTGWNAYMMFTERCLEHLNLNLENTHIQIESYEHLGEVKTYNLDLHQRYKELTDARRILLPEEDADLVLHVDFATPPHVTWEWLQDPAKRNVWGGGEIHWSIGDRPKGRMGSGASNHCAHGKGVSTEVTVDWRPFEYSTVDSYEKGRKMFTETMRFETLPDGCTRVHDTIRVHMPMPRWICRIMARIIFLYVHKYDRMLLKVAQLAGAEYQSARS